MRTPYLTKENHQKKLAEWQQALEPYEKHAIDFDIQKSALLVIDMQQYFLDEDSHAFVAPGPVVMENIRNLVNKFHEANRPVIFTYFAVNEGEPDSVGEWWQNPSFDEQSPAARLGDDLGKKEGDLLIRKNSYSTFGAPAAEKLNAFLKQNDTENIVICGIQTNLCCETAAREAFETGLSVFIPMDATTTKDENLHLASLQNMAYGCATVTDTQTLLK